MIARGLCILIHNIQEDEYFYEKYKVREAKVSGAVRRRVERADRIKINIFQGKIIEEPTSGIFWPHYSGERSRI